MISFSMVVVVYESLYVKLENGLKIKSRQVISLKFAVSIYFIDLGRQC